MNHRRGYSAATVGTVAPHHIQTQRGQKTMTIAMTDRAPKDGVACKVKLASPSLRLSTLKSGEPPQCISPDSELYIRTTRAPFSRTIHILYHSIHSPL